MIACHICASTDLAIPDRWENALGLVSSDARPAAGDVAFAVCATCGAIQKVLDATWQSVVDEVYDTYDINYQGGGAEPTLFGSAFGDGPRSEILLRFFRSVADVPDAGTLLDVGCSNGNLLQSFHRMYPQWRLHGAEISDHWETTVRALPGVEKFFSGRRTAYPERYDIISLSHVLEHVPDPSRFLAALAENLKPGGRFLIAVPDIRQNPIDLVIADHCTHFDFNTLASVMTSAGLAVDVLAHDTLPKELIAVAHVGYAPAAPKRAFEQRPLDLCNHYFRLLRAVRDTAREARAGAASFGIMGSSIAAVWLAGRLPDGVDFFVDEDANRIGGRLLGRPILSLDRVPPGATVYIPMSVPVAKRIMERARALPIRFAYLDWNRLDAD